MLYYKCHKISHNHGGSCIDSPDWIKTKKATINFINKKDRCFQNALTIHFSSEEDDWKKFEKNNVTIALNVLYVKKKKYVLLVFQNIIQIVEASYSFNDSKWRRT